MVSIQQKSTQKKQQTKQNTKQKCVVNGKKKVSAHMGTNVNLPTVELSFSKKEIPKIHTISPENATLFIKKEFAYMGKDVGLFMRIPHQKKLTKKII